MRQEKENRCKQEFDGPSALVRRNDQHGWRNGPSLPPMMLDTGFVFCATTLLMNGVAGG